MSRRNLNDINDVADLRERVAALQHHWNVSGIGERIDWKEKAGFVLAVIGAACCILINIVFWWPLVLTSYNYWLP